MRWFGMILGGLGDLVSRVRQQSDVLKCRPGTGLDNDRDR